MPREHPVELLVNDDLARSRLTVLLRWLLAIPHWLWLLVWSLVASLVVVVNWFAVLFAGRSPDGLHRFLDLYLRYVTQVTAYSHLIADPWPPFVPGEDEYPIDLEIAPPERQNRWITGFRIILAIPAWVLASVFSYVYALIGFFGWFVCLALGRMPKGMRDLSAFCLRYQMQTYAYSAVVTDRYPSLGSGMPA